MNGPHPIDGLFQEKLASLSYEAPMHIWDRIDRLRPNRKRPLWIFWFFPALASIAFAAFLYWLPLERPTAGELQSFPIFENGAANKAPAATPPLADLGPAAGSSLQHQASAAITKSTNPAPRPNPQVAAADPILAQEPDVSASALASLRHPTVATPTKEDWKLPTSVYEMATKNAADQQRNSLLLPSIPSAELTLDIPEREEIIECIGFGRKRDWRTTLDIMASPDFAIRQLEVRDPEFESYRKLRDDTETFRYAHSFSVRLSSTSASGLAVRSGLNLSAIHEQLNIKTKEDELVTITTKFGPDGDVIGADTAIEIVPYYKVVNNRFTTVDIPLLVGYEVSGEKISFSMNGGVMINMLFAQRGEFVSPNTYQPVSFSSNQKDSYKAYRNRIGLGLYGSMGVYFKLNDQTQLLMEPYIKYYPGSITDPGYIIRQRYLTSGLFVGLRRKI